MVTKIVVECGGSWKIEKIYINEGHKKLQLERVQIS
jgi:hypothetical protein